MDTAEKSVHGQQSVQTTEATLALPELVDDTKLSAQMQPKPIQSQG